jgi:3-oxoadipate enol-lactonase
MATIQLGKQEALYYEYVAPASAVDCTYVFFNALTGDSNMWEAVIAPKLRELGHGTRVYNFRRQTNSPFAPGTKLDADLILDDAPRLFQNQGLTAPQILAIIVICASVLIEAIWPLEKYYAPK